MNTLPATHPPKTAHRFSAKQRIKAIAVLLILTAGLINYFLFRPGIALFRFFGFTHQPFRLHNKILQLFFSGYFSDIAWCLSLCLVAELMSRLKLLNTFGKILILGLPFAIEAAQYFKIIQGTFDWYDTGIYATIVLIFYIRIFIIPRNEKQY
jgi:hypothetical protein